MTGSYSWTSYVVTAREEDGGDLFFWTGVCWVKTARLATIYESYPQAVNLAKSLSRNYKELRGGVCVLSCSCNVSWPR